MNIQVSETPLVWGKMDVHLFGVTHDWYGKEMEKPAGFSLAIDHERLWFIATHDRPAMLHPQARPGVFQEELWKYDVAEFFLLDPETGRYLEFNLSANGAWWSAFFTAPRVRENEEDIPLAGIETFSTLAPTGGWVTAAAFPLELLKKELNFGETSKMNVTFILNSPEQQFLTAAKQGDGEPDFHLPQHYKPITFFKA